MSHVWAQVYVMFDKATCGLQQNDRVCVVAKILLPSALAVCMCVYFGRIIT